MADFDPQRFTNDVLAASDAVTQQTRQIMVELAQHVVGQTDRAQKAEGRVAELEVEVADLRAKKPAKKG